MSDTVLVTGGSAGIGRALADQFADAGHDLVLVARREEKLADAATDLANRHRISCETVVMDLSEPNSAHTLFDVVRDRDVEVDVLVNNVGIGTQGPFVAIDADHEADQLALNVVTPTLLAKLFGRKMVERGDGGILNVASSAAFQPGPYMAVYYASKAYMLSLSEAIAEELDGEGVTVTALCPGPVETEFQERADMTDTALGSGEMQDVKAVARAGYEGLVKGKTVVVPGWRYKILWRLARVLPRPITRKLAANVNR